MTSQNLHVTRELEPDLWREFLYNNPQASIFHTPEMFEVFARAEGHKPGLWAALDPAGCPAALFTPVQIALLSALLSKSLYVYNWIKSFQLDASIVCRELPVNSNLSLIAVCFPSSCLFAYGCNI